MIPTDSIGKFAPDIPDIVHLTHFEHLKHEHADLCVLLLIRSIDWGDFVSLEGDLEERGTRTCSLENGFGTVQSKEVLLKVKREKGLSVMLHYVVRDDSSSLVVDPILT